MPSIFQRLTASRWIRQSLGVLLLGAGVVLLMAYLMGAFRDKIGSQASEKPAQATVPASALAMVEKREIPRVETAVGAIRPVNEAAVAAKLMARVVEVNVAAGRQVKAGDVLLKLDDADLQARKAQAQAGLNEAIATRDQAQVDHDRLQKLLAQQAATRVEVDRHATALKTAEARVKHAEQMLQEAETILTYATIISPMEGTIVEKKANPGDMVAPGQTLLTIYDPTRMQLVASVREGLALKLKVGQAMDVRIDAIDETCTGQISEIVPEAASASRSFLVKVTGPCHPGVYAGMFGRMLIPMPAETVVTVDGRAVKRVGQLTMVDVADDAGVIGRVVRLGRELTPAPGASYEVLSGLQAGEKVVVSQAEVKHE